MSKPIKKAKARLEQRRKAFEAIKGSKNAYKRPGSMNSHKSPK